MTMKKLKDLLPEKNTNETVNLNEAELNFKPQEGVTHQIVFKDPVKAYKILVKKQGGVPFDNVGFVFPKMSRETWMFIKDNFTSNDIGDMGQYKK